MELVAINPPHSSDTSGVKIMDFHGNLKNHLLRQVQADIKRVNTAYKDPEALDADMDYFSNLMKQQKLSVIAFNEHTRSRHTLLKTALDGVQ